MSVQDNQIKTGNLAQELYSKNVDLVNANKSLQLLQSLYDIIIKSQGVVDVGQQFIDKIVQDVGFTDGLVVYSPHGKKLRLIGITQTEVNRTILEVSGIDANKVEIPLDRQENSLVQSFLSGQNMLANNLIACWSPYIKQSDLSGVKSLDRKSFVFPITFGDRKIGAFAVSLDPKLSSLTDFEKTVLGRAQNVFGVALERVETTEKLRIAQQNELEKAKEVIRLKDEFVFIATHDLRTPATAISGFVSLIKETNVDLPESLAEDIDAIDEASSRLMQLVDDLLEVARSESGTVKIEVEPVDANEIINAVIKEVSPSAAERNIEIQSDLNPNSQVMADSKKLQEIIENLLSNAIKYNKDAGTVNIVSQIEEGNLKFTVSDTGLGIPQDKQEKVFSKFFRARQDGTENVPGTGLGLFVVRMLVEKMKGNITFESKEGVGTTFTFSLPLAK